MATRKIPTTPTSRRQPLEPGSYTDQLIAAGDRATEYARDVLAGRYVAGPHVRNACRRHFDDLEHGPGRGLVWNLAAAKHVWTWWESILKLSEGQFEGKPFLLHASQAFRIGSIFGWKRQDKEGRWVRRFRRFYDEEGKGNGKSPLAGGIGLYMLTADGEAGAQIYASAAKRDQAKILFADAVKMVRKSPALMKRLKFNGGEGNEHNIAYLRTQSFFRPISKDSGKRGSGVRPSCGLVDEIHELPNRDSLEMLERGFKSRLSPLLAMLTNSGSDRNSVCWDEHQHAVRVAAGTRTPGPDFAYVGEVIDDTTFAFVCSLDPGDDPLTDPSCWGKSNPLIGTILAEEYLAGVVDQAREMPGKRNGILRLHFCVWTESDQAWIGREALEAVLADFDPVELHAGKKIYSGVDLSGARDLTADANVVPTGTVIRQGENGEEIELPTFDAWIEAWTPEEGLEARAKADSAPYDVWVQQGFLRTVPGPRIRLDHIAAYYAQLDQDFEIEALAYDRYTFNKLEDEFAVVGLKLNTVAHPQAGKKRSRPTDAQLAAAKSAGRPEPEGLWMPGSLLELEAAILDKRVRLRRNPVLISACMSAATDHDALENRWFCKRKATQRIDPVVALAMAFGAATAPDLAPLKSVYETRGIRMV